MKAQIQKLLSFYQLSAADFAKIIGVNASGLSHILGGKRNYLSIDTILKIIDKYPKVNLDWLILGKGNMLKDNITRHDLFPGESDEIANNSEIKAPEILTEQIEKPEDRIEINLNEQRDSRKVEKILLFYSDDSYEEFISAK